jgi:diacylglycerol kinase
MWLHLLATILVTGLCFAFPVSLVELILIVIVTGLVWAAEIFNTVIEKVMDFISPAKDERIKRIKDMSAAAVLVSALVALITGCIVFIPKMI